MRRAYTVEIDFEDDITLAEQDRQVCAVLENLVSDWWTCAAVRVARGLAPLAGDAIAVVAERQPAR